MKRMHLIIATGAMGLSALGLAGMQAPPRAGEEAARSREAQHEECAREWGALENEANSDTMKMSEILQDYLSHQLSPEEQHFLSELPENHERAHRENLKAQLASIISEAKDFDLYLKKKPYWQELSAELEKRNWRMRSQLNFSHDGSHRLTIDFVIEDISRPGREVSVSTRDGDYANIVIVREISSWLPPSCERL